MVRLPFLSFTYRVFRRGHARCLRLDGSFCNSRVSWIWSVPVSRRTWTASSTWWTGCLPVVEETLPCPLRTNSPVREAHGGLNSLSSRRLGEYSFPTYFRFFAEHVGRSSIGISERIEAESARIFRTRKLAIDQGKRPRRPLDAWTLSELF